MTPADLRARLIEALGESDTALLDCTLSEIQDWRLLPSTQDEDWRSFLPASVENLWQDLPLEAKLVAFLICEPLSNESKE